MKDNAYINILKQNGHTISKPISNIDLFDFELDKEDMEQIGNLNENFRTCWDPTGM